MSGGVASSRGGHSPRASASELFSKYTSSPTKLHRSSSGGGAGGSSSSSSSDGAAEESAVNQVLQLNIVPRMFNEQKLMDELPSFLRKGLKAHAAHELLGRIPLLRGLEMPAGLATSLAALLKRTHCLKVSGGRSFCKPLPNKERHLALVILVGLECAAFLS
jgi:hypothetical protein